MKNAAIFFDGKSYCDKILEDEERKYKRTFSVSSSNSIPDSNQSYSYSITIPNSKHILKINQIENRDQSCQNRNIKQNQDNNQFHHQSNVPRSCNLTLIP